VKTFEEYQAAATQVPLSLRNDRDRIQLPVSGLQEEAGKIGSLLAEAFATGKFSVTQEQSKEVKERLYIECYSYDSVGQLLSESVVAR